MFGFVFKYILLIMNKKKIYLAGKIKPDGWRQHIIDIRNEFFGHEYSPNDEHSVNILKTSYIPFDEYAYVTGPFFLSCDHSCYHGDNTHGMGIGKDYNCYCNENFTESEVIDICKTQIKRADMIIAYIDDNTCYGTLYELGLAKEMGKTIVVIFDNEQLQRDMWFITHDSDFAVVLENDTYANYKKFDCIEQSIIIDIISHIKDWKKHIKKLNA